MARMAAAGPSDSGIEILRPLFETALDAVVAMWPDGTVAEWNQVAESTFGWSRHEALGQLMADLIVPPQHRSAHIEGILRYNRTGEAPVLNQRLEITAIDRDAREFPVELSITVTELVGGRLFIGFLRDISARKQSEQLLIRQAREAKLLFEISQFAAESEAVEPVLERTLNAICELAGWPVGHAFLVSRDNPDELVSSGVWYGTGDKHFERLREATRSTQFTSGVGLPGIILEKGQPVWMSDIESDAAFVRKGLGYGAAFGFPLKSSGQIVAVLEFFALDKTPPDPELLLTVRTLGEQVGRVFERTQSLSELRELNETLEQRVAERSRELEEVHEALRQGQRMESIGQLTGGIAHDFNNFLTVIKGSADLLRRADLSEDKRRRYIESIAETADRAARLTSQLLAFARRQVLKPELIEVTARISGISEMLRTILGSRIRLVMDVDCDDCLIEADAAQFETVLVNLVINARDAMNGEGTLTIAVKREESAASEESIVISISDTGHGIPADQLEHIFEPFFTTKEVGKGTGLGLSQVYGFIKQSDGEIEVKSREGGGTTFVLSLPSARGTPAPDPAAPAAPTATKADCRVLVVEDNQDVGEFAASLLAEFGFRPTLAATAREALERLEEQPEDFDLVFTDVVMPGMNGVDFARLVRQRWPRIPVILTSGYSEVLAEEAGHGFLLLHKPYSADDLARIFDEARRQPDVSG